jgi:hypothetical protein
MIRENLLEVILERQDSFPYGLCMWIFYLCEQRVISKDEYNYLDNLLEEEARIMNKSPLEYLWPSGEISYRIEWLKSKLEKK